MLDCISAVCVKSAKNLVALQILEFGMVAGVDYLEGNYFEDDFLELTMQKCSLAYSVDIIEIERIMLLDILFMIWKQVIIYLKVSQSSPPLVIHPLFIGSPHRLHFFMILT